jgi:hypothetical protein
MRYLSAVSTVPAAEELERAMGPGRLRPLAPGDDPASFNGERFAGIIADDAAQLPSLRHGLPVVLIAGMHRRGLRHFRDLAEDGIDVRLWTDCGKTLSETTLHCLTRPRAPSPAAVIVGHLRGRYGGLAADIVTATALLGNGRRSMDEIARACESSPSGVRIALREARLPSITAVVARMRALHAVWSLGGAQPNFWAAAGFRTLAEVSAHLSHHIGSPLGGWRGPDGFSTLLHTVTNDLEEGEEDADEAATG